MLKDFNKIFGIPLDTPLKRLELEDAIIKKFGSIQYFKYDSYADNPVLYSVGTKFEWEVNTIETQSWKPSIDEALMELFIEFSIKSESWLTSCQCIDECVDDFYDIIKEVYADVL